MKNNKNKADIICDKIWVINDEGRRVECDILFTFDSEETKKSYIVYTDNTLEADGSTKVYASVYDPEVEKQMLKPVESDEEWKIIEEIIDEIQNNEDEEYDDLEQKIMDKINSEDTDEVAEDDISWDDIFSDSTSHNFDKPSLPYEEFVSYIENNLSSCEEPNKQLLMEIAERLETDTDDAHIEYLFNILSENNFSDDESYFKMGIGAYDIGNFVVAEEAYRRALKYCEKDFLRVKYANNLAYMLRRKEVKNPKEADAKEIVELLKPGVSNKDTFSLINMALFLVLRTGSKEDWEIADQLVSAIDGKNVYKAYLWWSEVGRRDDIEGYVVHLLLVRNRKIVSSILGDIKDLFNKIKNKYFDIPEDFQNMVITLDFGEIDKTAPSDDFI